MRAANSGGKAGDELAILGPQNWCPLTSALLRPLVATVIALLGGCSPAPPKVTPSLPKVTVLTLKAQSVAITTELPGRVVAYRISDVRPQVNGVILKRLFIE